jgi:hypothetical protein
VGQTINEGGAAVVGQASETDETADEAHWCGEADCGKEEMSAPLENAVAIAVGVLRVALEKIDGDFEQIDFAALHERWFAVLTAEERAAVEAFLPEMGPITAAMVAACEAMGATNLPPVDVVH